MQFVIEPCEVTLPLVTLSVRQFFNKIPYGNLIANKNSIV
jgi:hypothetical protein